MKYTDLEDFYWLCGSSRAGKTAASKYLEREFGFHVYHFDEEVFGRLWNPSLDPEKYPAILKLVRNEKDWEAYYSRPIGEIVEETHAVWRENWPLVLEDIRKIRTEKPVLIEGGGMYPEWVSTVAKRDRIHYYIPAKEFQRKLFLEGMRLEPGEVPAHEGQFFHAYADPEFIVNQRIEHHDAQARYMRESARKLRIAASTVECFGDFERNTRETVRLFGLEKKDR